MRMRKKSWAKSELAENKKILHDPQALKGKWQDFFGDEKPIHIELGCGKGRFISQTALNNPTVNHIAVERQKDVLAAAARLADKMDAPAFFINADVKGLSDIFAPGELGRIYLNFSDPWPNRKKWEKRRLTHVNFLSLYESLLAGRGEVFFKTDNRQLFEFSINQFSEKGWIMRNVCLDLHHSNPQDNVMTEYEEKFSSRGSLIYRLEGYPPQSSRI